MNIASSASAGVHPVAGRYELGRGRRGPIVPFFGALARAGPSAIARKVTGPASARATHVAAAIGHALVSSGRSVLFAPTYQLVQELLAAKRDLTAE